MKSLLTLLSIAMITIAFGGCKSEEEKIAEQKHQQDIKDYSNRKSAGSTWIPPNLGAPKNGKDAKP
ncbi:hypothetical protein [Rhodoferax sp. GW822-FHT02A01]|uniref:hypothetical protein n=1 Tax=Rhodoferax sp. GW822-FHT02A01 TaxID=3141537 RepID=UPI00315D84D0